MLAARGRNGSFRGGGQRVVGRLREQARRLERFERVGILFPSQGWSPDRAEQPQKDKKERRITALEAPRRPPTPKLAHDQSQVERCYVHQQTLENIRVMPQMHASHPARFIAVRKAPFHLLAPLPQ